ncbi:MAG: NUDIX domain-containing protein [bacterium]
MKEHRISAAAIVLHNDKILLVRYHNPKGQSFLVGPGGGVQGEESMPQAIIREVEEETGIEVRPTKMLFVEEILSKRHRMVKTWFLCEFIDGELLETEDAKDEGIIEVCWYKKEQLTNEIVYPEILKEIDWTKFKEKNWELEYLGIHKADF